MGVIITTALDVPKNRFHKQVSPHRVTGRGLDHLRGVDVTDSRPYRHDPAYLHENAVDWEQRCVELEAKLAEAECKVQQIAEIIVGGGIDYICSAPGCSKISVLNADGSRICSIHLWRAIAAYRDQISDVPPALRDFVKRRRK